jgi:hypothetical protein
MKRFFKSLIIIILIIAIILGAILGYFYRQAQSYIQSSGVDTTTAITRTIKSSLRNSINNTSNASLLQILQYSYDSLHQFNIQKQQNSGLSAWEHTIRTEENIVDIAIQIPWSIATQISTQATTGTDGIIFQYEEQYIGSFQLYTQSWWAQQEELWLFNNEKIAEQSGYVIAYAQVLDNPFTGMELEAFGEIAAIFNTAISSTQIVHIQTIDKIIGYITSIQTGDTITITIDPITILTGEVAAAALAEYEPDVCASIISGTEQTLCFPPNNLYILNQTSEDGTTFNTLTQEGMQIVIELINTGTTQAVRSTQKHCETTENYNTNKPHLLYIR